MKEKLSENPAWMIFWFILFFPVGLCLMWLKHPKIKKSIKIIITIIYIIITSFFIYQTYDLYKALDKKVINVEEVKNTHYNR